MSSTAKITPTISISKIIAASALSSTLAFAAVPAAAFAAVADTGTQSVASVSELSDTEADLTGATSFAFSDDGIAVEEGDYSGYKIEGCSLSITKSGTYVVSGTCADGSITVKKGVTGVTLVLNGLDLTSSDTAPICCNKSSEVEIVAAEGTTNTLTDSETNNDDVYADNESAENAVIKSKDGSQVTLCGTGTLNVVANGKNGIKNGSTTEDEGEASLTIRDLTLNITAVSTNGNDAINAESNLYVESGTITIAANDDAIHSDYNLTVGAEGTAGPTIKISTCCEGLEAATLVVDSGDIDITASDDGLNAANSDLTDYDFSLTVNGGTLRVNAGGDGLDSNGALTFNGGTVIVYAADDQDNSPFDSDGAFTINGGTLLGVGHAGMTQTATGTQSWVIFGNGGQGGQGGDQPSDPGQGGNQPGDDQPSEPGQGDQPGGDQPGGDQLGGGQPGGGQPSEPGQQGSDQPGQPGGDQPSDPGQGGGSTQPDQQGGATLLPADTAFDVVDSSNNVLISGVSVRDADYVFYSSSSVTEGAQYSLISGSTTIATATAGQTGGGDQPTPQPQPQPTEDAVTRLAGETALDTMAATVQKGFADGSCSTVIVATIDGYWDALSAASLAGIDNCPVLITDSQELSEQTASEIDRLGATKVIIAGGTEAVSANVASQIERLGCAVSRAAGENAIGTSLEIYALGKGSWGTTCVVATSGGYYDALSASSYAYAKAAPIFLANEDGTLSSEVLAAIEEGGFTRVVIAGGTDVVSADAASQLEETTGSEPVRCGGANCFETSVQFAQFCVQEGMTLSNTCFATGLGGYYDALTGAALAGKSASPILLIDEGYEDALDYVQSQGGAFSAYVFGGPDAISADLFDRISDAVKPQPR